MAQQYGTTDSLSVTMAGPFGNAGGTLVKLAEITLLASNWKGAASPYSQVVAVENVSVNSMVNLQLGAQQYLGFALTAENDGGVVTVYAIGDKPEVNLTVQATIMEVVA